MSFADYSGRDKCERTIREKWDTFRSDLANGRFKYDDIKKAKIKTDFMASFDDIFSNCHKYFDSSLSAVLSRPTVTVRAGKLMTDDPEPTYSRFIPDKKYITEHNRFSPPGVEWLYLSIGNLEDAEMCALKECRASDGDKFGLCEFRLNEKYAERSLVDLTIADGLKYDEINSQFEAGVACVANRVLLKSINEIKYRGYPSKPNGTEIEKLFVKWAAFTYAKLLSREIFLPVETEDKELMYSPFQCMAQYFLSYGYEGIVYSSTVFPKGKNVVIFDKYAANPTGKIKIVYITE